MGLGDEFDGHSVHAYQLADFADTCQLPRSLVAQRFRLIIKKLMLSLDSEIKQVAAYGEGDDYLKRYQSMIHKRCEDCLGQVEEIVVVRL